MPGNHRLSESQLRTLDVTARVSACLSILGALFVIGSFVGHRPLRKPINRLVVAMSIANIPSCLAYSWGRYGIKAGAGSALCQTQAFLIMWLVMTDPILVFLMSLNVFLTVRRKAHPQRLNILEVVCVSMAYMIPFAVALVFLVLNPGGKKIYGEATMWCWISQDFNLLRLVTFYVPVWSMISASVILFILSGRTIFLVRSAVKEARQESENPLGDEHHHFHRYRLRDPSPPPSPLQVLNAAKVREEIRPQDDGDTTLLPLPPLHFKPSLSTTPSDSTAATIRQSCSFSTNTSPSRRRNSKPDHVIWVYSKFALLYALVLIITWVPISANRVYNGFLAVNHPVYGLYVASAISIPLHGFGNFIIYVSTSWNDCQDWVRQWKIVKVLRHFGTKS